MGAPSGECVPAAGAVFNTKSTKMAKGSRLFAVFVFFVLEKGCLRRRHAGRLSRPSTQSCLGPDVRRDERGGGVVIGPA